MTKKRPKIFKPPKPKVIKANTSQFFWILLTVALISLIGFVVFSNAFTIKQILCHNDLRPCSQSIEAELEYLKGKSTLLFRVDKLENKLIASDFAIGNVDVKVTLPSTIKVVLSPRIFTHLSLSY